MITNLRTAFNELLTDNDWMDDATRTVAKEKADAIQEKIGYSEEDIKDDNNLNKKYENVTYQQDKFFENDLLNDQMVATETLKKLREPVDKNEWGTDPAVVNAYYSSTRNQIMFPAGILQPPFFNKNYPKSLNYGGIGMVIGHEITHGFDDRGRRFDKDGDLSDWWSPEVIEKFKERAGCIVDQYFDYFMKEAGMNLNGNNTQGENIADNGGIKQSYTAYRDWVEHQGKEEPLLPGLKFNHNQLFFINFAQIWCGSYRPENAINRILTGVHSPGRFRVIGTLHNSPEFAKVFDCPDSSYMNAEKKCRVW